jgi:hypothetical protein
MKPIAASLPSACFLIGTIFGRSRPGRAKVFALAMIPFVCAVGQDQVQASISDLQKELVAWQQKIKDMEGRIAKTDAAIAEEVSSFRSYLRTEAARKAQFQAQNDSLSLDIAEAKKRADSLEKCSETLTLSAAASDNQVEEMRLTLLAACGDLKEFYASLPPSNVRVTSATLEFLKGELEAKTVTASEAIERYSQILGSLEDAEGSMETYAGVSPVPGIAGQASFVRIGLAYLAVTSEEGKAAFVWVPGEAGGEGSWQSVTEPFAKAALWDAVRIRDRKIVPRIVDLQFNNPVAVRSPDKPRGGER